MSEYEDDDAQEEEVEEETFLLPNPTTVPTSGYRPVREGRSLPSDSHSPEPMELETGEPDEFSQEVLRQEEPPLRIQPHRKCKLRAKPTTLDQGMRELTAEDRQLLFRQDSTAYKTTTENSRSPALTFLFLPLPRTLRPTKKSPLIPQFFIMPVTDSNSHQTSTFSPTPRTRK